MSITIALPHHVAVKVKHELESGLYGSAGELVGMAMDALKERERDDAAKLEWLRKAIQEGEESGEPEPWDSDEIIREGRRLRDEQEG